MSDIFDCIVLGAGGFGSGALYHLARRGVRVLGIEQFGVAHDRGSSHGETRIIRQAYFEHPDYVPLLRRAYDLWHALECETNRPLLHPVGLFIAGLPTCEAVSGTILAARQHQLPLEVLTASDARRRFPGFRFHDDFSIVFEPQAGYLEVENCVSAHVAAALRCGAVLRAGETAVDWWSDGHDVVVRTDKGEYGARSLVITAGPWASRALNAGAGITSDSQAAFPGLLRVIRKPVFWFEADSSFDVERGIPTFFFETPAGQFYGFPRIDGRTVKVAEHTEGMAVEDPLLVDRFEQPDDLARLGPFLAEHLPGIVQKPARFSVCMYTKTPDGHFCIDRHPQFGNVSIGAGFSGHGFKFTSVLGEALADLALAGATKLPVEFLSVKRFATR